MWGGGELGYWECGLIIKLYGMVWHDTTLVDDQAEVAILTIDR